MLLYFGSKSMMPAAGSLVCESAHTCSAFAQSDIAHVFAAWRRRTATDDSRTA